VKAEITIPLNKKEASQAIKAIGGQPQTKRVKTEFKATSKGLEIIIKAKDVTSMRAAVNTALKLYKVHEEVKSNG